MRLTKNISLWELIPQREYEKYGEKSVWFIDPRVPLLAQFIRDWFSKPLTINTWRNGGDKNLSGFRPPDCEIGASYSQHKFGRALDFRIHDIDSAEIREVIRNNFVRFNDFGLSTIEEGTPTWVHIDCRTTNSQLIYEVPYK